MYVACIGVVVGLWDFGDFYLCGVFVSGCFVPAVCMTKPLPVFVAGASGNACVGGDYCLNGAIDLSMLDFGAGANT